MRIGTYVRNKMMRMNTAAIQVNGKWVRLVGSELVPEKKFQAMYPVDGFLNRSEYNPDRTNLWLNDQKSY